MRLEGRVAIVTGAGSGVGKVTAELFAAEGAKVVVADRDVEHARAAADGIGETGGQAAAVDVEVSERRSVEAMVTAARQRFGPVEILVNAAGIVQVAGFAEITPADWQRMLDVHLTGSFLTCQAVLPGMIAAKWGRIVNTAAAGGMTGVPRHAHFAAAKAATIGLTRSLALEYARHGVTVNAVAPGLIEEMLEPPSSSPVRPPPHAVADQVAESLRRQTPMRRAGSPMDVAQATLYLASNEAGFVTGQVLSPNGGLVM